MNRHLQTAFNKMQRQTKDVELSKKINLAAIDVINDNIDAFEEAELDALYLANDYGDELIGKIEEYRSEIGQIDDFVVNSMATSLLEISQDYAILLDKLDAKAEELGLDPRDIFDQYDEAREYVNFSEASYKDAQKIYKEVVEYAGFLNDFWR